MNANVGSIGWIDLTVQDAEGVRDFYKAVVGWESSPVKMGDYDDFCMIPPGSETPAGGICHARGSNADQPPIWMVYITVADLDAASAKCKELGGQIVLGPKECGEHGRYCVIKDPAGAVAALFEGKE